MVTNAHRSLIFKASSLLFVLSFSSVSIPAFAQTSFEPAIDQGKVEFPEGGIVEFPEGGQVSFDPEGQVENTVVFSTDFAAPQEYFAPYIDATLPAVEQTLQGAEVEIESSVDWDEGANAELTTER